MDIIASIDTLLPNMFATGTIVLGLLLLFAAVLHINNLSRVHKLMAILQHKKEVSKDLLYKEMSVAQGINFTALALASWIMLFVAVAYLYLLVPTFLPISYMDLADLASSSAGFAAFGIIVAVLVSIIILFLDKLPDEYRNLKLTEIYSFYSISKGMKKMIGMTVVFLCFSILLSAYAGTIYPARSITAELSSLILLVISTGILVMPVFKEAWEAKR